MSTAWHHTPPCRRPFELFFFHAAFLMSVLLAALMLMPLHICCKIHDVPIFSHVYVFTKQVCDAAFMFDITAAAQTSCAAQSSSALRRWRDKRCGARKRRRRRLFAHAIRRATPPRTFICLPNTRRRNIPALRRHQPRRQEQQRRHEQIYHAMPDAPPSRRHTIVPRVTKLQPSITARASRRRLTPAIVTTIDRLFHQPFFMPDDATPRRVCAETRVRIDSA